MKPPAVARALVGFSSASEDRAFLLEDLADRFGEVARTEGLRAANRWYWSQALSVVPWALRPGDLIRRRGRGNHVETLLQDVRYAVRKLRTAPSFTAIAALTVALGIGATTTIFSVANAVIFRAPPGVSDRAELVTVHGTAADGSSFHAFSFPNYLDYREGDNGLTDLAAYSSIEVSLGGQGDPELLLGNSVTHNYFDVVGTRPAIGRFFLSEEDATPSTHLVAVLSHNTWKRRFLEDPAVIGRTINLNRSPFTVIGVAEEGFAGHNTLLEVGIWIPVNALPAVETTNLDNRSTSFLEAIGRRSPDTSVENVQDAMSGIAQRLEDEFPIVNQGDGIDVRPYSALFALAVGPATGFALLLFAGAAIVLVIASMNVGGMLLARASRRGHEIALRLAIGASRTRLIRQLVTESVLLFLVGGGAGIALTVAATRLLNTFQLPPLPTPLVFDFSPDMRVLAFSLSLAFVTGIAFGLTPALNVTRPDLGTMLKAGSVNASGSRSRLRSTFVVGQVAGSALLLICAALFARALGSADTLDMGFDPDGVHVTTYDLGTHNYTALDAAQFHSDIAERVAAMPRVESFGLVSVLPLGLGNRTTGVSIEGADPATRVGVFGSDRATITPGYMETLRIPIVRGRTFTSADDGGATGVVVVNETLAQRAWPGEDPIGKRVRLGTSSSELEVVGVARTAKYRSLGEASRNMVYRPLAQAPMSRMTVVARVADNAAGLSADMRSVVAALDPDLPVLTNTYAEVLGLSLLPNRAAAMLATLFGVVGLILAAVGLYGVLSYAVSQRVREIGIRMALGARHRNIRSLVILQGTTLVGVGLAIGFLLAMGVTRFMEGLLFGVSPTDPTTFAGIGVLLLTVAVAASSVPAFRATRTDPVEALRHE